VTFGIDRLCIVAIRKQVAPRCGTYLGGSGYSRRRAEKGELWLISTHSSSWNHPRRRKPSPNTLATATRVLASVGHVRDLVQPEEVPAELKPTHGQFGVDVENGFAPLYIETPRAKSTISDIKKALKNADQLLLATDEDREGESIAWHLREILKPKVPVKRMVFHEITKDAITEAVENPREIDMPLVDAQETRRILDRLFGYQLSPVLWSKVGRGLSAGRVQSPALRLIVERERERQAFAAASYWDVVATVMTKQGESFGVTMTKLADAKLATGRDFDDTGKLTTTATVLDEVTARQLAQALEVSAPTVSNIEAKPYTRRPAAPFTTSTLQQEAGRKLRLGSREHDAYRAKPVSKRSHHVYANGLDYAVCSSRFGCSLASGRPLWSGVNLRPATHVSRS